MLPHIYKDNGTLSIGMPDGAMKQIDTAHRNYDEIVAAMKDGKDDKVIELINIAAQIETSIRASANTINVKIIDGEVLFDGEPVHTSLTTRIIKMADEGFDIAHLVVFLENLMQNPSYRAVNELYNFLEAGSIPITEDGTFLSYKKVNANYKDIHSGTFDNSVGCEPEMPRNRVNEDSSQTCSAGLHLCSYDYLPHFGTGGGSRVMICEVNPRDVVSIPDDYNNSKMRVCKYKVIGEIEDYRDADVLGDAMVMAVEDVPQVYPEVTDDQLSGHGKALGKMVSNELDNDEITIDDIVSVLNNLNVHSDAINTIVSSNDNKRIGKQISKAIRNKIVSPYPFEDALMEIKAESESEEEDDTCSNCGAELHGNYECDVCNEEEEDEELTCERCGAETQSGDDECSDCGFYFQ